MAEKIRREIRLLHAYPMKIDYVSGTNMIPVVFEVMDYELPVTAEAKIFVKKPSGNVVFNDCEIDGNEIEVTPTAQMFAEAGENVAQIQIIDDEELLNSYPITFKVYPMIPDDEAVESTNEFGTFETLLNSARSISYDAVSAYIQENGLEQGCTPQEAELLQSHETAISRMEETVGQIDNVVSDMDTLEGTVETLSAAVTAIQNARAGENAAQRLTAAENAISDLETTTAEFEAYNAQVETMMGNITDILARIENIEASLASRTMDDWN